MPILKFEEEIPIGVIEERKSIRAFSKQDIPDAVLQEILYAGLRAPSPKNRQPWYFLVSRSGAKREVLITDMEYSVQAALARESGRRDLTMALESVEILRQAPVVIFVCYRLGTVESHDDGVDWPIKASDLEVVDLLSVGAAIENILLTAAELGLGGLWCGDILYAYQDFMRSFPTSYPLVSAVCLGYPAQNPPLTSRYPLSHCCCFLDKD